MYGVTGRNGPVSTPTQENTPMHRPLRTILVLATTALAVMVGSIAPVGATTADQAIDVAQVRPVIDDRPDPIPLPSPVELLKLRCRGVADRDGMPGVLCKWTRPTLSSAEVLVLERNSGEGFEPIWRTENLRRRRYFDEKVEPGQRYRYRVRVYDARGTLVAASRANGAGVPLPDFELMKLHCSGDIVPTPRLDAVTDIAYPGQKVAKCEWSEVDAEVRAYQLWRIVNRGHRELVGTYDAKTFSARDRVPNDAHVVRYAVLALDHQGNIVGRSRIAKVRFPVIDIAPDVVTDTPSDRVG